MKGSPKLNFGGLTEIRKAFKSGYFSTNSLKGREKYLASMNFRGSNSIISNLIDKY